MMSLFRTDTITFEVAQYHFNAFAANFLEKDTAKRWQALFAMNTSKAFMKIDPWLVWNEGKRNVNAHFYPFKGKINDIQKNNEFCLSSQHEAIFIGLGHAAPCILVKQFSLTCASDWPLEGIVSFEAGQKVFVINHDGDVCFCKKSL